VEEQRRRSKLIRYDIIHPQDMTLSPSSKLRGIEENLRSLYENPALQPPADNVQDDEEVSGLLEDLREIMSDYQVCSQPWHACRC